MADASDISQVRVNVNEAGLDPYTDQIISDKIDALGVAGASASIWQEKAASFAGLSDVTEAGASHKFSDLYKSALAMFVHWSAQQESEAPAAASRPIVRVIERS